MEIEEIIKKYENGERTSVLAEESYFSSDWMSNRISRYYRGKGIKNPITQERHEKVDKVKREIEKIYQRRIAREKLKDLAEEYDVSPSTMFTVISEYCEEHNKPRPERLKSPHEVPEEKRKAIQEEYTTEGVTIQGLADKYQVSVSTVINITLGDRLAKKQEEEKKKQEERKQQNDENTSRVIELYESGKSIAEIKNALDMSSKGVRIILMNYMDVQDGKLSPKSIEVLQRLGYDINLIRKVATEKKIAGIEQPGEERE